MSANNSPSVGRGARIADFVSLLLVVAGAALFAWTFLEMRELRDAPHDPAAALFSYRARYDQLSRLSYVGLGVIVAGITVGIAAALRHRRRTAPGE